jgi:hypothetical protein
MKVALPLSCDVSSLSNANVLSASKISNLFGHLNKTNVTLPSDAYFGDAIENIGDLNGDGVVDIVVSV